MAVVDIDSIGGQAARDTAALLESIAQLKQSGQTDKTDEIEKQAQSLIEEVEEMVEGAAGGGQGRTEELLEALRAQETTLTAFVDSGQPTLTKQFNLLGRLKDLKMQRAALMLGRTLDWDSLISAEELQRYRQALTRAAAEVRRRRKLASFSRSILDVFSISLKVASRLAAL